MNFFYYKEQDGTEGIICKEDGKHIRIDTDGEAKSGDQSWEEPIPPERWERIVNDIRNIVWRKATKKEVGKFLLFLIEK